jgi:hypothetical protein
MRKECGGAPEINFVSSWLSRTASRLVYYAMSCDFAISSALHVPSFCPMHDFLHYVESVTRSIYFAYYIVSKRPGSKALQWQKTNNCAAYSVVR